MQVTPAAPAVGTKRFVSSWSGGKDSCLALYRSLVNGAECASLFTVFIEDGQRSRSHGLTRAVITAQAASLGFPLTTVSAAWADYETRFIETLKSFQAQGINLGVFGDIDIERHRHWEEQVCAAAGLTAHLPLWQTPRAQLLEEFLGLGFKATLVAVQAATLGREFLGRELNPTLIAQIEERGLDACGENGEYHTVVTDGPIFRQALALQPREAVLRDGYWFLDMQLAGP